MAWVLEHSPYEGGARTLHIVLAFRADARRRVRRAQRELARDCNLDVGYLRKLVRRMIEDGLVELVEQAAGTTPALLELHPNRDAVDRARGRALPEDLDRASERALEPIAGASAPPLPIDTELDTPPTPRRRKRAPSPHEPVARELVGRVWENRSPRPAGKFMTLVNRACALLDAGHAPERVEAAFMQAPTVTVRACEFWLNNGHAKSAGQAAVVDEDRDGPTGRVEL